MDLNLRVWPLVELAPLTPLTSLAKTNLFPSLISKITGSYASAVMHRQQKIDMNPSERAICNEQLTDGTLEMERDD
jgi:hypothetical protein